MRQTIATLIILWGTCQSAYAQITMQVTPLDRPLSAARVLVGEIDYPLAVANGVWTVLLPAVTTQGTDWFQKAELNADFPAGESPISVPLRLSPELVNIPLPVRKSPTPTCLIGNFSFIELESADLPTQLRAYIAARDLYFNALDCGPSMKRRIAKSWFDRSFSLAKSRSFISLDSAAVTAAKSASAYSDQQLDSYIVDVLGYEINLMYQQMLRYQAIGKRDQAAGLNEKLTAIIQSSEGRGAEAAKRQKIDLQKLDADRKYLVTLDISERLKALLAAVSKLSDETAIALAQKPPVADPALDKVIAAMVGQVGTLTASQARDVLKRRIALVSGQADIQEWEAALKL